MANLNEILIVDDDLASRARMSAHLQSVGYKTRTADNGFEAWMAITHQAPNLIIADFATANLNSFNLLRSLRQEVRTRDIGFIMMVAAADGPSSKAGMDAQVAKSTGADAVVNKPIEPADIAPLIKQVQQQRAFNQTIALDHVLGDPRSTNPQANEALSAPFNLHTPDNPHLYNPNAQSGFNSVTLDAPRLDQHTLPANFAQFVEQSPTTMIGESILDNEIDLISSRTISKRNTVGTVLFSDIRNFSTISEKLESEQVVEMLNAYFARACEPIQRQHGWVVKFLGDGLVALFESPPGQLQDHAERAMKSGLLMILAASRFRNWIAERHPDLKLPEFSVGVGIHTGEITVCKMGAGESVEATIIGDSVNIAARLEEKTKELGWSIVASRAALDAAGGRIVFGQRSELPVKGRVKPVEIVNITGLKPKAFASDQERKFYDAVSTAVAVNSRTLRTNAAAKIAQAVVDIDAGLGSGRHNIPGYQLIRKLGEGGMSLVWLAQREATHEEVVLKLLPTQSHSTENNDPRRDEILKRFIQEYALISQIDHPNVAKIYQQGFSESYAYISMEYFPGGDLRVLSKGGLKADVAQAVLIQIAGALAAIHARGIVHRDMKPDNVMLRNDGSLALADFGIAKHIESDVTHTQHGEVFGTPYYLSPEQALGSTVDQRSDIYSLGIMLFEILTGRKPYYADNAQSLLYQHVHAPVPTLPAQFAQFQPLLAKMLAKQPEERFARADDIIDAVIRL